MGERTEGEGDMAELDDKSRFETGRLQLLENSQQPHARNPNLTSARREH